MGFGFGEEGVGRRGAPRGSAPPPSSIPGLSSRPAAPRRDKQGPPPASQPPRAQTGHPSAPRTQRAFHAGPTGSGRLCALSKLPHLMPQPQGTWQDKRVSSGPKAHLLYLLFTHGWNPGGKNRNHSLGGTQSPAGGRCRRSRKGQHWTMPKHQVWGDGGEMGREVLGRGFWGRGILDKPKVD